MELKTYSLLLAIGLWRDTNAEALWQEGLDFGEDEERGRSLQEIETEDGHFVKVVWREDDKTIFVIHHFNYPEDADEATHVMFSGEIEQIV